MALGIVERVYRTLMRRPPGTGTDVEEESRVEDVDRWSRIRCPHCQWQPDRASRWQCSECREPEGLLHGCGTVWNTFQTRGRCPGCQHQWRWTSCPACSQWAPHDDWYEAEDADE